MSATPLKKTTASAASKARFAPLGIAPATWLRIAVHIGALIPLALIVWDAYRGHLTANPIQDITFRTGKTAITLLVLSLVCTPLNTLFGLKFVLPSRRPLGLYAFFYVCLHLLIFAVLDYGLDWGLIQQTIAEKRYVLVGFAAFLLLLPLAATSTKGWMRRLGKRWKQLHRLVYLAAILAVVHFVWLVKADIREPLVYGAILALLLALRLAPVRRAAASLRARIAR
ncbi:MAG TPA: protein-methionine-sulfoxide reductase heme-binding subunit MsrQ [Kouleothrix sp.]|uniref:sulfite oxidase heme-binding subunit YedZ n=1 Tax=Kouleothrix sp. TaxID=2779161 RepID=UPI002B839316|nr:protein-methionine-sulfoxide reductase heme-binding subunit MsrQ [Kouleothrix sp.]